MKSIINYGISYNTENTKNDITIFSKQTLVYEYLKILNNPGLDVSSLTCYQWEGSRNPVYKDITADINKFLMR